MTTHKAPKELEQVDIEAELEAHENYLTELNTHSINLTKERATVERALEQAENVHKLGKELDDSESALLCLVMNCMMTNLKK